MLLSASPKIKKQAKPSAEVRLEWEEHACC